jgi:hypothetical protein
VFWLKLTTSGALQADLDSVNASVATAANSSGLIPALGTQWVMTGSDATWIYSAGNSLESHYTNDFGGTGGTCIDNAATCAVVDWLIGRYYRGGHPRTYFGGIATASVTSGSVLGNPQSANIAAGAAAWLTAVNALTHGSISAVALGTVSFAQANAWRSPPVFEAYTGSKVRTHLGTQKRRIGGR